MRRAPAFLTILVLVAAALAVVAGPTRPARAAFTPPPIKVAIVWSEATRSWTRKHHLDWGTSADQGYAIRELKARGWDLTVIHDGDLSDLKILKRFDVVVLPHVFAMDPVPSQVLRRYVAEGGGLVSLFASPRVAPALCEGSGSVWPEHWIKILRYRAWEWGPLSEVYQTALINDPMAASYVLDPMVKHPIVSSARGILAARGYGSSDLHIERSSPGTLEMPRLLADNTNATTFVTARITKAIAGQPVVAGTVPAAVASNYYRGRSVYFYFKPMDFLPSRTDWVAAIARRRTTDGTPQGEIVVAYVEAALTWTADKSSSHYGKIVKGGKTKAKAKAFRDAIYVTQTIWNDGNSPCLGNVACRIYAPNGRLAFKKVYKLFGTEPGVSETVKYQFRPGGELASGRYRVQVTYDVNYPSKSGAWIEEGRLRASGSTTTSHVK